MLAFNVTALGVTSPYERYIASLTQQEKERLIPLLDQFPVLNSIDEGCEGIALFEHHMRFNHACLPNVSPFHFHSNLKRLVNYEWRDAVKGIKPGSKLKKEGKQTLKKE